MLTTKIRNRIAQGAAVREVSPEQIPAWFAAKIGEDAAIQTVFTSDYATAAILENGRAIVSRTPRF